MQRVKYINFTHHHIWIIKQWEGKPSLKTINYVTNRIFTTLSHKPTSGIFNAQGLAQINRGETLRLLKPTRRAAEVDTAESCGKAREQRVEKNVQRGAVMIIHYDGEPIIINEPEPLHLNLKHQAKVEAILILREDFALTWSAIAERMGMSEGAIRHLLNQI